MKRAFFLTCLLTLFGCTCLPQIPPQYLKADNNCEAFLPNYLPYVSVLDNCEGAVLTQEPLPGTLLDAANPYLRVAITATDISGNTDHERFDVFLDDGTPPEIIWDSIPGDTLPVVDRNTGLIKAFYSLLDYDIKQGHDERFPGDSILVNNDSIQKYVVWSMEME